MYKLRKDQLLGYYELYTPFRIEASHIRSLNEINGVNNVMQTGAFTVEISKSPALKWRPILDQIHQLMRDELGESLYPKGEEGILRSRWDSSFVRFMTSWPSLPIWGAIALSIYLLLNGYV